MLKSLPQSTDTTDNAEARPKNDREPGVSSEEKALLGGRLFLALAIALCVVHVGIRAYDLDAESLDFDESMTWTHTRAFKVIPEQTILDVHPPLYFILVTAWRKLAGSSQVALRAPSLAFSLLSLVTIMALAFWARPERGRLNALIVGLIFCFLPYEIYLSRLARSWTMLIFLSSLQALFFFKALEENDKRWFAWSLVTAVLAVYTHYMCFISLAATVMAALITFPDRKANFRKSVKLAAVVAVAFIPWAPFFPLQIALEKGCWHIRSFSSLEPATFLSLINPGDYSLDDAHLRYGATLYYLGLVVAGIGAAAILLNGSRLYGAPRTRALIVLVLCAVGMLAVSPIALCNVRTLCVILVPVTLLLGSTLTDSLTYGGRFSRGACVAFLIAFLAVSLAGFPYPSMRGGWKDVCLFLKGEWPKSKRPALLLAHAEEILPYQYQRTRIEGRFADEVWVPSNSISIVLTPFDRLWKLRFLKNPPSTVPRYKSGPAHVEGLIWSANHIFRTHPEITDIWYIRRGSRDLFNYSIPGPVPLGNLEDSAGFSMNLVTRFSAHAIYRLTRKKAPDTQADKGG